MGLRNLTNWNDPIFRKKSRVVEKSDEVQEVMEGSIAPGAPSGMVIRPKRVIIMAFDRHGHSITVSGSGFLAATFCHEIDHLDGIMFIDKAKK